MSRKPRITLGEFADIVSKAGSPKATKIAQIKNGDEYACGITRIVFNHNCR